MINKLYNTVKLAIGIVLISFCTACNDSFMDRFPETSITDKVFFNTPTDLEIYTNGLYDAIGSSYWDVASDNLLYVEEASIYQMMRGEISPKNAGQWGGWDKIRAINYMLARTDRVVGDEKEINHYIGIAKLFRAKRYYDLVRKYSDVPWYSRDLQTTDTELLYKTQDPRTLVVDSIMADLDFAVNNIKADKSKTRITLWSALSIQARIALEEGTFRKYHDELGLTDADMFLTIASKASKKILTEGGFSLSTAERDGIPAYEALFCSQDLTTNSEMILVEDYDKGLGRKHNAQSICNWTTGLSRDLMEDYLVVDDNKTITFQEVKDFDKKSLTEIYENRDLRLAQTFMRPGYIRAGNNQAQQPKMGLGGYPQIKFDPRTEDQISWGESYTDLPVIRLAEIMLIYAEAQAELGLFTQDDMDATINKTRARAGLPTTTLSEWINHMDPIQVNRYSNVSSAQKGAVLEIRRERRIELACEGFRYNDLKRWKCGKLMEKTPEGCYINGMGLHDITGDGVPDIAIVATPEDAEKISDEDKEKYKLTVYTLEGNTFQLTEGNKGFIQLTSQIGRFTFIEPKYYYQPIDEKDIVINENLEQNKFWKE